MMPRWRATSAVGVQIAVPGAHRQHLHDSGSRPGRRGGRPHPDPAAGPGTRLGEPPRVLVVDDDPRTLRFVRDALAEAGYAPLVTGSLHDLPRTIRTERPRQVQLD